MSDELEARMWDDGGSRYESRTRGPYFESAFASSEHLDRAPLLSEYWIDYKGKLKRKCASIRTSHSRTGGGPCDTPTLTDIEKKYLSILGEDYGVGLPGIQVNPFGTESTHETYTDVPVTPTSDVEHCHWKLQAEPPSAIPQLLTALVLCAIFMVCELIGGYLAGSLSVMSDAAHMLSDCGGFALALLAFHCAKRRPDVAMSYGYKRAEVLGAMLSVLLIWILTGIFVYVAIVRLHTGEYNIEPDMMMIVSGCGVGFNVILALVLHGCASDIAHHHTHGGAACAHAHSHGATEGTSRGWRLFRRSREHKQTNGTLVNGDYTMKDLANVETNVVGSQPRNINLRAALIHVIGDLIQSCGVLLASILIKFYPEAKVVDPICTFVFSFLVLLTSAQVVRDALAMLMQAVPKNFRYRECVSMLSALPGVRHVHSVHVWALSTHYVILTAHVAIDELTDPEAVLHSCQQLARAEWGVAAATFQVERYSAQVLACRTCALQPAHTP